MADEEEPTDSQTITIPDDNSKPRSLLEKWRNYLRGIPSPDTYINWGFYYLIGAALQRRVWTGASHEPLFPNPYVILVGRPGIGKGRVITPVNAVLRHHKIIPKSDIIIHEKTKEQKMLDGKALYEAAMAASGRNEVLSGVSTTSKSPKESPNLFPVAADATTYQALIKAISKSTRAHVYVDEKGKKQIYTHATIAFCLEELSSLFRKHTEDVNNFLLVTYDCKDYIYDTISRGEDIIKKCCVSMLAGTTPDFMQSVFGDATLTQGSASRTIYVFAANNRHNILFQPELDELQKDDFEDILAHIKKLSEVYGHAKLTPEAHAFMVNWWELDQTQIKKNFSPKLENYYPRKNIHVLKLATAIHFADSLTMEITLEDCKRALAILDDEEVRMHYALQFDKGNPLAKVATKVEQLLKRRGVQTRSELLFENFGICNELQMKEVINALVGFGKVKAVAIKGSSETGYEIVKEELKLEEEVKL